jgi:hypothetical protein
VNIPESAGAATPVQLWANMEDSDFGLFKNGK